MIFTNTLEFLDRTKITASIMERNLRNFLFERMLFMNIRGLTKLKIGAEIGAAVITTGFAVVHGIKELKGQKIVPKVPLKVDTDGLDDDIKAATTEVAKEVVEAVTEAATETVTEG